MAGRIRTIKPELLEDARVARLSSDAFRLFIAMLLLADDHGGLRADIMYLRSQVFWGREEVTSSQVGSALHELASSSPKARAMVELYEVRGQFYAHILGWEKHQKVNHPGRNRVPLVDEPICRRNISASDCFGDFQENLKENPLSLPPTSDQRSTTSDQHITPALAGSEPSGSGLSLTSAQNSPPANPSESDPSSDLDTQAPPQGAAEQATLRLVDPIEPSPAEQVYAAYVAAWRHTVNGHRPPKFDDKRRKLVTARLREFDVEDLILAARGVFGSSWHVSKRATQFELVFRDSAHVERFRDIAEHGDPERPKASTTQPARAFSAAAAAEKYNAEHADEDFSNGKYREGAPF